jgi:D-alanyl-D-alanine carboxypeptidase
MCGGILEKMKAEAKNYRMILVNNEHPLPEGFVAKDLIDMMQETPRHFFLFRSIMLNRECFEAANHMFAKAEKDGLNDFIISSGFRTRKEQEDAYGRWGEGKAARPGCSEHQTGLAIDLAAPGGMVEGSAYYEWLLNKAADYGFILRYPKDRDDITGYNFEPWHWRYVGVEAAREIMDKNIVLEEYYKQILRSL